MSSPTPVIFDDGSKAMVSPDQLSAALKDGGKVAQAMRFDDGSHGYVPLDRVHDAIHDGGMLLGAMPAKPNVTPQSLPETDLEQFAAHRIDNLAKAPGQVYAGLKDTVPKIASDVYDVSAPGIATEVYKAIKGQANKLKELPPKMIMAWLAAGGLPEADTAELGAGKAATETAAKTASEAAPAEAAPVAAKAPVVPQPPVAAPPVSAPPVTAPPTAPPPDPLLERLRAFAGKIEDEESAAPTRARKVSARAKVRTATAPRVPISAEDQMALLQESVRRLSLRDLQ